MKHIKYHLLARASIYNLAIAKYNSLFCVSKNFTSKEINHGIKTNKNKNKM